MSRINDDYITGNLLDYEYFPNNYNLIATYLNNKLN